VSESLLKASVVYRHGGCAISSERRAISLVQRAGSIEQEEMSKGKKNETGEKLFRFQDLEIWKKAIEIGDKLLDIADELERKKLSIQICRANSRCQPEHFK